MTGGGAAGASAGAPLGGAAMVGGMGGGVSGSAGNGGGSAAGNGGGASGGTSGGGSGGGTGNDRSPAGTCARWKADTANLDEGTWSGSVGTCSVGDISVEGRANALRMVNLVRWLADLPAVTTDTASDQQAQACALMMTANDQLSHEPPMSWDCYSELGADGAGSGNISSGPGVESVLSYMVDAGNATTLGHRRWILSNELGPIGLGSAGDDGASCMRVFGGEGEANKAWLAWPPPGAFPVQAYRDRFNRQLDDTGWSIQSELDLAAAQVTITSNGQARPVTVTQLLKNYGAKNAISIIPQGWEAVAGTTYAVSVTGVSMPINYEVQLVDCE
ncbi:MAG TPA: CAP domain-containing protein [Polyangiaceae bacterium]